MNPRAAKPNKLYKTGTPISMGNRAIFQAASLVQPIGEYYFHPFRKFRFDYAWPDLYFGSGEQFRIALEVQGGIWTGGKHGRGSGIEKDYEKMNEAILTGWKVFQVTPTQFKNLSFAKYLLPYLRERF